ncbi:MAG: DUF4349 domain-containing protein [Egibacteraceae bacterium]
MQGHQRQRTPARGAAHRTDGARASRTPVALVVALAALLALAACEGEPGLPGDDAADESVAEPAPAPEPPDAGGPDAEPPDAGGPDAEAPDAEAPDGEAPQEADPEGGTVDRGDLGDAELSRRVVREGTLTVRYGGDFDAAYDEVASIAEGLGGVIVDVESRTQEELTRGTVTVEVPVDRFDELVDEAAAIGEVERRRITTQDVTTAYVDLESRLRHLNRQEEFYLDLFDEAETVEDALAVSRHLEDVQQRREQVQGRLDALERRTSSSTLRIELVDERADLDEPVPAGLRGYWDQAREAFVDVAGLLLVVTVGGAPLLLSALVIVLVVLLLVRLARGRRRRPGPAGPADEGAEEGVSDRGAGAEEGASDRGAGA